ncbi:MAG TPA: hypothetical protein VD962_05200 [Rubricoccaceae bacterium]|nr:hypothetical protein [Rubricoccaceae bacterium]
MKSLFATLIFVLVVPVASSQPRLGRAEQTESSATAYYRHYQPGELTVQVSVVGAVEHPGLYEVGTSVDVGRILSLAGGPRVEPRERRDRRTVEVRLYRPNAGPAPIYATTLQATASAPGAYPVLEEGDTLFVDVVENKGLAWQDVFTIAGGLSAVAVIIGTLAN